MANLTPFRWEGRVKVRGETRWVRLESLPRRLANGDVVWTGVVEDITDRKSAEAKTAEAEGRFRLLAEVTSEGIMLTEGGMIIDCNDQFAGIFGYERAEMIGRAIFGFLSPESAEVLRERVRSETTGRHGAFGIRKDGSRFPIEADARYAGFQGRTVRVSAVRDLTAQRRAEEALRSLNEVLEHRVAERTASLLEANRELEAYSYSVAHELRTPLRAIDGHSALIARDYDGVLDDEARRHFGQVRWNAQRMGQLIDDFLAFSGAGRSDLFCGPVDMTGAAKKAFARVEADPASLSRVAFSVGDLPDAHGDARLLSQVWESLISNAVKFSAGREKPEIQVEGGVENGEAVYRVRDNGVGFDMKYVDRLFGVFQRLQGMHEFEGTGIGLALVRRIVVRHGGRVWAEGEVGKGATFSFGLPVK